jgi:6-phosphogluconolactonase
MSRIQIRQCETPDDVALAGANFVAARATEAIAERGQFTLALSGGGTPWIMLGKLAESDLPWDRIKVFQVDERVAADGDQERNLVHIRARFTDRIPLPAENLIAMPVASGDLSQAARRYEVSLIESAGDPPVLDLVHLGLGGDGHTASLVPGDAVLNEVDHDVAITDAYVGWRRMTLTYSIINRARHILWLVTGEGKAEMLHRLIQGDSAIPAGRVSRRQATVVADAASLSRHIQNRRGAKQQC